MCDAGEERERYETNTAVSPRCECTRERGGIATVTAIYDVYGVGVGAMCGGEEEAVRPASPLSRRHARDTTIAGATEDCGRVTTKHVYDMTFKRNGKR